MTSRKVSSRLTPLMALTLVEPPVRPILPEMYTFLVDRHRSTFHELEESSVKTLSRARNYMTVTKISADGSTILYSTHLRNSGSVNGAGIAVDPRGNAYVTGVASASYDLNPTFPDPIEPNAITNRGSVPMQDPIRNAYTSPDLPETRTNDAFLLILNPDAKQPHSRNLHWRNPRRGNLCSIRGQWWRRLDLRLG